MRRVTRDPGEHSGGVNWILGEALHAWRCASIIIRAVGKSVCVVAGTDARGPRWALSYMQHVDF